MVAHNDTMMNSIWALFKSYDLNVRNGDLCVPRMCARMHQCICKVCRPAAGCFISEVINLDETDEDCVMN